jgi:2-oxoglutarate dehydrogenase E1 component
MSDSISSVFNDGYIAEVYEAYRRDPSSVDESWRQYFRFAERLGGRAAGAADPELARKAAGAAGLMYAIRTYGHLSVRLDPLGTPPPDAAELRAEFHRITESDLADVPGAALGFPHMATAADVIARLRFRYSRMLGIEYTHLTDEVERQWFRELLTAERLTQPLARDERVAMLRRLTDVEGLERFLGRTYVGYKRFSIEGTDMLVPMLDTAIGESANAGAEHVMIAMAHRGRLNVLTHVIGKSYEALLAEFEGHRAHKRDASTGDVKYHLGADGAREVEGRNVELRLMPNPSHLEIVNPVLMGATRYLQRRGGALNTLAVVPICVHGDASFTGEGIVPETFNLSRLRGYQVGGTLHIIVNNQVGFTTDPVDGRSTYYASDVAKGFEIPVIHVNADDPESCVIAMRIATAYRNAFHKDFLVDLVGYRRHGHNEGDEPAYTQPTLYERIKAHATVRAQWGARLVEEGIVTSDDVTRMEKDCASRLNEELDGARKRKTQAAHDVHSAAPAAAPVVTAVPAETLRALNERILTWPAGFEPNARLAKQLERRRVAISEPAAIDWGHAEALAFASILHDGTAVRVTGQDVERGTFSHRHAVLHDSRNGMTHAPLAEIAKAPGWFEICNSPLSEMAAMGFEYGFSVTAPDTLTVWEAQFGDFANVAQPVIDQFLAADRAKWGQDSGLVLLLPHGYEGAGPEHSSARLERFLQLCAEGNLRVAYPSSPAQYFHILRRQAKQQPRRPLVLMQPKWMLRLAAAMSSFADLTGGAFRPVIDDANGAAKRETVRRLVCCTGKVYWELAARPQIPEVAVVRIEELYPWPHAELERVVDAYPNVEQVAWVQEEPKNQGAWSYVAPLLRVSAGTALEVPYVGRAERASPAEGYQQDHAVEQERILDAAYDYAPRPARRRSAAVR